MSLCQQNKHVAPVTHKILELSQKEGKQQKDICKKLEDTWTTELRMTWIVVIDFIYWLYNLWQGNKHYKWRIGIISTLTKISHILPPKKMEFEQSWSFPQFPPIEQFILTLVSSPSMYWQQRVINTFSPRPTLFSGRISSKMALAFPHHPWDFTYIYYKLKPNAGKYTILVSYIIYLYIYE